MPSQLARDAPLLQTLHASPTQQESESNMDSNKGKGKAPAAHSKDSENAPSKPPEDPSLLSRVAASASGLTRSALTAPNPSETTTAAALSSSAKGTSSSAGTGSGSSAYAESSQTTQIHPSQTAESGGLGSRLRAGHSDEHAARSEQEFSSFLDGVDSFQPSELITGIGNGNDEDESTRNVLADAWTRSRPPNPPSSNLLQCTTVTEQESKDGEAVLAILSSTHPSSHEQFSAPEPETEEQAYDWGLSAEQKTELRAMTKDLFGLASAAEVGAATHAGVVDAEHPLNLIPQYGDGDGDLEAWREQWEGVLTRYTDEVWGGLLPLVREARREVEGMRKGGESGAEKSVALRRLGAILGHLQGR